MLYTQESDRPLNVLNMLVEIDASGNISLADGQSLDYETAQQHELQIRVSDLGGLSDIAQVTINVTDVNEQPKTFDDVATTDEDNAITIDVMRAGRLIGSVADNRARKHENNKAEPFALSLEFGDPAGRIGACPCAAPGARSP